MCAVSSAREATNAVSGDAISYAPHDVSKMLGVERCELIDKEILSLRKHGVRIKDRVRLRSSNDHFAYERRRCLEQRRRHFRCDSDGAFARTLECPFEVCRSDARCPLDSRLTISLCRFTRGSPYSTRTSVMTDPPRTPPDSPAGSQGITRCCDGSVGHDLDGRARLDAELRQRAIEVLFPVLLARDAEAHPTLRETLAAGLPDLADDVAKR